jgi:hypothetical protein
VPSRAVNKTTSKRPTDGHDERSVVRQPPAKKKPKTTTSVARRSNPRRYQNGATAAAGSSADNTSSWYCQLCIFEDPPRRVNFGNFREQTDHMVAVHREKRDFRCRCGFGGQTAAELRGHKNFCVFIGRKK